MKVKNEGLTDETDSLKRDPEHRPVLVQPHKGEGSGGKHLGNVWGITVLWGC